MKEGVRVVDITAVWMVTFIVYMCERGGGGGRHNSCVGGNLHSVHV